MTDQPTLDDLARRVAALEERARPMSLEDLAKSTAGTSYCSVFDYVPKSRLEAAERERDNARHDLEVARKDRDEARAELARMRESASAPAHPTFEAWRADLRKRIAAHEERDLMSMWGGAIRTALNVLDYMPPLAEPVVPASPAPSGVPEGSVVVKLEHLRELLIYLRRDRDEASHARACANDATLGIEHVIGFIERSWLNAPAAQEAADG